MAAPDTLASPQTTVSSHGSFDGLPPLDIARKAESIGVQKANMAAWPLFLLAVLAGAFIALGSLFCTTITTGTNAAMPYGVGKALGGLAFSLGLILVVVGGAELFTGNNLLAMAFAGGRISAGQMARNWVIVYAGNFVGAMATAAFMFAGEQHLMGKGAVGAAALAIAEAKCSLSFTVALVRGVYCNALVCLAVWLCYSCRTTGDKILAIVFPITAFVAAGFEHCVANMYLIPMGLFIQAAAPADFWALAGVAASQFPHLTWANFLWANLLPVTIGNIIGGSGFVGMVYWMIYLRAPKPAGAPHGATARLRRAGIQSVAVSR